MSFEMSVGCVKKTYMHVQKSFIQAIRVCAVNSSWSLAWRFCWLFLNWNNW